MSVSTIQHPLSHGNPPAWASAWGQDPFGIFAELALGEPSVTQRLRWIPPGHFLMGSAADEPGRFEIEGPRHQVTMSDGFWIFDTPCRQDFWEKVTGENPSYFVHPRRPVETVSWNDCRDFLDSLRKRTRLSGWALPTEAQWEYACRAGTSGAVYSGDYKILGHNNAPALDEIAWYGGNSGVDYDLDTWIDSSAFEEKQFEHKKAGTRIVGLKKPNRWGLYDVLGNVLEWCDDGRREYENQPEQDPVGVIADGSSRVLRGGSWLNYARIVRSAYRNAIVPDLRNYNIGFRPALVQGEPD